MLVQGYRVLSALVARAWCLVDICSKHKLIDTITNPSIETSKIGIIIIMCFSSLGLL